MALTRAKKESYLIADANAPSEFINELFITEIQDRYCVQNDSKNVIGQSLNCNECSTGYFRDETR
ncbi:Uncharacterised protein [Mannheimia haemolytica]|uniref:Uncharacterized protein n=1 Tax=Mannheimia haemolytica TaxID=75985 RepID=A0A378MWV4_MANHA|nr:Uncharacterised protein [Mannheimia haemolytica]